MRTLWRHLHDSTRQWCAITAARATAVRCSSSSASAASPSSVLSEPSAREHSSTTPSHTLMAQLFGRDADVALRFAAPSLAERFGNTHEAALYVHGSALGPFLKRCATNDDAAPQSATQAMRQLREGLLRAAEAFNNHAASEATSKPAPVARVSSPIFMRSVLEQTFLSLYLDEEEAPLLSCLIEAYPFSLCILSDTLRSRLEDAVRVLLQATAFSFHLAIEDTIRQHGKRRQGSTGCALALEVFALWWWANPDLVGFERRGTERFLPLNRRGVRALAGQAGSAAARPLLAQEEVFDDRLHRLLTQSECILARQTKTSEGRNGDYSASPDFRAELADRGGFLSCDVVLSASFREALARLWAPVPSKAHYITCSLLPRMVELALAEKAHTTSPTRGEALVTSLFADWTRSVLCAHGDIVASASVAHAECVEHWSIFFASLAAVAALTASTTSLRQSRKVLHAGPNSRTYGACLAESEAAYVQRLDGLLCGAVTESCARHVFRTCALSFEVTGLFQSSLVGRPGTHNALWADLTARLSRAFPAAFQPGHAVTALWTLVALEHLTAPQTFAQVTAVDLWRHGLLREARVAPSTTDSNSHDPALFSAVVQEGVYVPTWSRVRQSQWLTHALVQATASAEQENGQEPSDRVRRPSTDHGALQPSFSSSWPLMRSTRSVVEEMSYEGSPSPMRELLLEAQSAAYAVFRAYAASTTTETTPLPSIYVFVRLVHFLARLGEPTASTATFPLLQAVQAELLPECHRVLHGSLEKTLAAYVAHSAGPHNARALLTSQRALVDSLPSHVAWGYLVESLVWSGLPWNALETVEKDKAAHGQAPKAHPPREAVFGLGSLAWEVLRRQQPLLLALCDPASPTQRADAVETDKSTPSHAQRVLLTVLSHLLALALQTPEATSLPVFLYPTACRLCDACAYQHTNSGATGDGAPFTHDPLAAETVETAASALSEEDVEFAVDAAETAAADAFIQFHDSHDHDDVVLDEEDDDRGLAEASQAATSLVEAAPLRDGGADGQTYHGEPRSLDEPQRVIARAEFVAILRTAAPRSGHLFVSLVSLLSWALTPPSSASVSSSPFGAPACENWMHDTRPENLAVAYVTLMRPLVPGQPLSDGWHRLLSNRRLTELVCLVVMHTLPDVFWLACLLVRWQSSHSARGKLSLQLPSETPRAPQLLTKRLEASLLQLLYHGGATYEGVCRWRVEHGAMSTSEDADGGSPSGHLRDPCGFHTRYLTKLSCRLARADAVAQTPSDPATVEERPVVRTASLNGFLGSVLLTSFETRARHWRARQHPTATTTPLSEVMRVFHPHNHYLSCFFGCGTSPSRSELIPDADGSSPRGPACESIQRAIWPDRQLFSFSPLTSSAFNVLSASEMWQRDGRRILMRERHAVGTRRGAYAVAPTDPHTDDARVDDDVSYLALFSASPRT